MPGYNYNKYLTIAIGIAFILFALALIGERMTAPNLEAVSGKFELLPLSERIHPLPNFSFKDVNGQTIDLYDFRGKTVLLNFWATWCKPCLEEMPSLDRLATKMKNHNLVILPVAQDRNGLEDVRRFYAEAGVKNLPVYLEPTGRAFKTFGLRGLPTTFLIDEDSHLIGKLEGTAEWDSESSITFLKKFSPDKTAAGAS